MGLKTFNSLHFFYAILFCPQYFYLLSPSIISLSLSSHHPFTIFHFYSPYFILSYSHPPTTYCFSKLKLLILDYLPSPLFQILAILIIYFNENKAAMQDGLEPLQIKENRPIEVRVFAGHMVDTEYQIIGDGYFQLVTDFLIPAPQHYIQVTDPRINQLILRSRLQKTNGYQRKKNTIIAWFDPEQPHEKDIALSFLHKEDCNMYWKLICSKIGKDYLQINRNQRLEKPTKGNSQHLASKAKASYELVAFNVINSEQFMTSLWSVYDSFREEKNQEGVGNISEFFNQILSHWDPKIMRVLLKTENFEHFLSVFQCTYIKDSQKNSSKKKQTRKNSIILRQYENLGKFKKLVGMSETLIQEIEIGIKGKFFREMLNFNELLLNHDDIVRMVDQVLKDSYLLILNLIIQQNTIHQINQHYKNTLVKQDMKQEDKTKQFERIVMFFKQIYTIIWYLDSSTIKQRIFALIRDPQNLQMFARILDFGCHSMLEILTVIAKEDRHQFFKAYKENYRSNSKYNLNLMIGNIYLKCQSQAIKQDILRFYKEILTEVDTSRQNYQYFNGTILVTGFDRCSNLHSKLSFALLALSKLQSHHFVTVMNHFLRKGLLDSLAKYLPNQTRSNCQFPPKHAMLELVKILKIIIYRQNVVLSRKIGLPQRDQLPLKTSQQIDEQRKIHRALIDSKIVYLCFQYLEKHWEFNNLITSSILQILQSIANSSYTLFTKYIQDQYKFELADKNNTLLEKYINEINEKVKPPNFITEEEKGSEEAETHHLKAHKHRLEQQIEQEYLMGEQNNNEGIRNEALNESSLLQLLRMKEQIQRKNEEKDEPRMRIDSQMQQQESFEIKFDLPEMEEQLNGEQKSDRG